MNTFRNLLLHCTKKELTRLAKIHCISGYSVLNKADLAKKVFSHLSKEETMIPLFCCISKEETALLTRSKSSKDSCLARRLSTLGYCFLDKDGNYMVPDDLSLGFLDTADFQKAQHSFSLLTDILSMGSMLYGCMPVSILTLIYCRYTNSSVTSGEIKKMVSKIPASLNPTVLIQDLYVQTDLEKNDLYRKIQKCQGVIPYYIPPKEAALHFTRYGYFNDPSSRRLALYFHKNLNIDGHKTRDYLTNIQAIFRQGGSLFDAAQYLKKECVISETVPNKTLMVLLNDMFSHTRLLLNRGYTELEKISQNKSAKNIKISPNSPCPCGSGKKYKKCCGKN